MGISLCRNINRLNQNKVKYHIEDEDKYDPKYLFKITVDEFDIDAIRSELNLIAFPDEYKNLIMSALIFYHNSQEELLIKKVDSLLFHRGKLPLLEVRNKNAVNHRRYESHDEKKISMLSHSQLPRNRLFSITLDINDIT